MAKEHTYIVDGELPCGEFPVTGPRCNRVAVWCGDASETKNRRCENSGTHKPVSNPPFKGVHGAAKLDWVTEWFLGWKVNSTISPT